MRRSIILIGVGVAILALIGCSGGSFTPNESKTSSTDGDSTESTEEELPEDLDALPPEVISGAYLTCVEDTHYETAEGMTTIGCNIQHLDDDRRLVGAGAQFDWEFQNDKGDPVRPRYRTEEGLEHYEAMFEFRAETADAGLRIAGKSAFLDVDNTTMRTRYPMPIECRQRQQGISGVVYAIPENTRKLPDFSELNPIGQVARDQLDISPRDWSTGFPGHPDLIEYFAIDFQATLRVAEDGNYRFKTNSDDGSKLWIDGDLIVDNDGRHGERARESDSIFLKAGAHKIRVGWFQGPRHTLALEVFWAQVADGPGSSQSSNNSSRVDYKIISKDVLDYRRQCDLIDFGPLQ